MSCVQGVMKVYEYPQVLMTMKLRNVWNILKIKNSISSYITTPQCLLVDAGVKFLVICDTNLIIKKTKVTAILRNNLNGFLMIFRVTGFKNTATTKWLFFTFFCFTKSCRYCFSCFNGMMEKNDSFLKYGHHD